MNRAKAAEIQSEPKRKIGRWDTPSAFFCPRGYGECENARACVYPGRCGRGQSEDISPTITKIPLRAEVRDMLTAADCYESNARRHDEEAERLRTLAKQAREQSANLMRMANL